MILYEFEGKEILSKSGINVPKSQLVSSANDKINLEYPVIIKAQVLSGKRKIAGGILKANDSDEAKEMISGLLSAIINKEKVESILLEEEAEFEEEYYLSVTYDTTVRGPILSFTSTGGTGIEERGSQHFKVDPINKTVDFSEGNNIPEVILKIIPKFLNLFFSFDLLLLEINPLIVDKNGEVIALDAKLKTDDNATTRHKDWNYPPRSIPGHEATEREIEAKKIDEGDYRGTAGSAYFDLHGDIAVLASGGGASLMGMDALILAGGKPANYTEYSSNPSREKVKKLTKIVISKPNIKGLWIAGAIANFTDIYETLSGILEELKETSPKPKYPIVIRRGGPRDKEAFEMLEKEKDFDFHLYGSEISISQSAKIMAELTQKYATTT